jgi:N-methylhydantoinase A
MLVADVICDYTHTIMFPGCIAIDEIRNALAPLIARGFRDVQAEGIPPESILIEPMLDMRYRGQSYELTIPFGERFIMDFHEAHHRAYGTSIEGADVEIVNIRVRATGRVISPSLRTQPAGSTDPSPAWRETRKIWFSSGPMIVPLYHGESLNPGNILTGPAVVVRSDTTILIGSNDRANVDGFYNLIIDVGK